MKNRITLFIMVLSGLVIFQSCTQNSDLNDPKLQQLSSWMTGSFSSKMQSEADTNFFNIHLHMVPIWQERTDAIWLYVEQAAAWSLDKPYRQRVYKLRRLDDNLFESSVFSITDPIRFAGD